MEEARYFKIIFVMVSEFRTNLSMQTHRNTPKTGRCRQACALIYGRQKILYKGEKLSFETERGCHVQTFLGGVKLNLL